MHKRNIFQLPMLLVLAFGGIWICGKIVEIAVGLPLDDAYIFKRYALNLAGGFGFSFNPGERSFGCSSYLWTVLMAGLVKVFGKEHYYVIAQGAGIFFTAAAIYYLLRLILDFTGSWIMVLAGSFLAWLSSVTLMNALSGMESGLFSFLVMLNISELVKYQNSKIRGAFKMGVLAGLIFLTRPEGLYFGIAIAIILFFKFFKSSKLAFFQLILFTIGFAVLAAPYLYWVRHNFNQFLPYTVLAKIYTSDPNLLNRDLAQRLKDGLGFLLSGWYLLVIPWKLFGYILGGSALLGVVYAVREFLKKEGNAALVLMAGWMFLPFAYGYGFAVTPHFGGYYQRYISSVWLVIILLGLLTMNRIYLLLPRIARIGCLKILFYSFALVLVLIYCWPIAKGQVRDGRAAYNRELNLNQGLRMSAAAWLKQDTAKDARVLVGYTGLGVVGGECDRYVLDVGALINPDLFKYLEGTVHLSEARWKNIISYACEKKMDYFVSFAPIFGPDPAKSPGFSEKARFGFPGDPKSPYEQIRIYQIDRALLCGQSPPKP